MTVEIKVPQLPESIADATVAAWHKKPGDSVQKDETLVDLETDKVVLEVYASDDGILESIVKDEGETVLPDEVIGILKPGAVSAAPEKAAVKAEAPETETETQTAGLTPAVRRLISENNLDASQIKGTGKGGKITKDDVKAFMSQRAKPAEKAASAPSVSLDMPEGERVEKRVPMTRLRARVAERLLQVTNETAMLTTFNEVNMEPVMTLRARYKEEFMKEHNVKLGFMSFFTRAVVEALKRFPAINASIDGNDIVYHGYYDIGIAVSSERGLVVPVLRNAEMMTMAQIEAHIAEYAQKARSNKLSLDEITGGTFTITNGGVFGSLLSTPILNSPQSAILGMHAIKERPVAENGQVVIRPMMNLALSYDHRIVDGKESVTFLVAIKELLEDPARLLLDV